MLYIKPLLTIIIALLCCVAHADVKQSLEAFNKNQTSENANRFFVELKAAEVVDEDIKFDDKTPAETLRAQVWYWTAEWYYAQQQYTEAVSYAKQALPLCKNTDTEADCLSLLAITNVRLADYEEAAKYAKLCYAKDEASGDPDLMSSSLNTLAAIYMGAGQPNEAEKYVLKGIEMAKKANNPARMAVLQGMASEVYHAQGNDQEALKHIDLAYEIDEKAGNEPKCMVRLTQKASILIGLHDYKEAEKVLGRVIPYFRKTGNGHELAIACNKMGMTLLSQERPAEAVPYYREAADILQKMGDIYNEVHARRGLYESLWKDNPDEAKEELDRFNYLKDSIYTHESAEQLARYNAEFGNDWLQLENHSQRMQKLQAVGLAVVIALIAIGVWFVMRRRNRRQKTLNEQLRNSLQQLNEQYRQLNIQYDHALQTTTAKAESKDGEEDDNVSAADREFLEKTINIVNQLISDGGVDATSVAARLNMSLFQFRQRLSKVTEETPQTFIQMIRMKRARHLLDNHPELNINEIAVLCAYNDTPNFTRAFKKVFGLTPTQYQEKQK